MILGNIKPFLQSHIQVVLINGRHKITNKPVKQEQTKTIVPLQETYFTGSLLGKENCKNPY